MIRMTGLETAQWAHRARRIVAEMDRAEIVTLVAICREALSLRNKEHLAAHFDRKGYFFDDSFCYYRDVDEETGERSPVTEH